MTRIEAYNKIRIGKKVSHKDFLNDKYLWGGENSDKILTEDNYNFSEVFWSLDRFNDGWEIKY